MNFKMKLMNFMPESSTMSQVTAYPFLQIFGYEANALSKEIFVAELIFLLHHLSERLPKGLIYTLRR